VRRRRRQILAVAITALALVAAGVGIATAHTWASCHNSSVASYPRAYPQCGRAEESHRPVLMAGAGTIALLLGIGSVYVWTEDQAFRRTG
jgi:hypothetical protein